jgi:hypothetical protein
MNESLIKIREHLKTRNAYLEDVKGVEQKLKSANFKLAVQETAIKERRGKLKVRSTGYLNVDNTYRIRSSN